MLPSVEVNRILLPAVRTTFAWDFITETPEGYTLWAHVTAWRTLREERDNLEKRLKRCKTRTSHTAKDIRHQLDVKAVEIKHAYEKACFAFEGAMMVDDARNSYPKQVLAFAHELGVESEDVENLREFVKSCKKKGGMQLSFL